MIFVNGWTDAPNAIATMVSTRSMSVKKSIALAAVFNFFGVFIMTSINATVAATIANMVDFFGYICYKNQKSKKYTVQSCYRQANW